MKTDLNKQVLKIKTGRNFRELGGYPTLSGKKIKHHKLLRTGHLADLNNKDQAFLKDYGVASIVDFRSHEEVTKQPDQVPDGINYYYDPVFSEDLTNSSRSITDLDAQSKDDANFGFDHMLFAYEDMVNSDSAQKAYRLFFEKLLANNHQDQALLFHCTAGKDRTGFGALLVLTALGVPLELIKKDYLFTNEVIGDFVDQMVNSERQNGKNDNTLQSIRDIQSVHAEYFDHALKVLTDEYGSINNYLHQVMQLSSADLIELRRIYLA